MTTRTLITFVILAALCWSSISTDIACNCAWLQTNQATIDSISDTGFLISSVYLGTAYIPSDIKSACGNIGVNSLIETASEERAVSRKGSKAAFALAADDDDEPSSFLELTTGVTSTDVLNALEFDTYCIEKITYDTHADPIYLGDAKTYCHNPLIAYFTSKTDYFPSTKGQDTPAARANYLAEADTWYGELYNYLGCTFQ